MKNILSKVYKKLRIIHNIYIKNRFLFKKKLFYGGEDLEILRLSNDINNGFYVDVGCYHLLI